MTQAAYMIRIGKVYREIPNPSRRTAPVRWKKEA